jgi:hypothetical protein
MKVTRRLKILLIVLAAVIVLSAALVAADLLPALARMRERRKELDRIEAEIQRSLLEVRLRAGEAESGQAAVVPELPEIAAFISTLRKAQDRTGVTGMAFDAVQTERQEVVLAAGMSEETQQYLLSRLTVSFSSSLEQTTEFLKTIQSEYPAETFDYLRLSSRSPDRDRVDVSMAVSLYGIPR